LFKFRTVALAHLLEQIKLTSFTNRGKDHMETVAYLEVAQDYENSELQSYDGISERIKLSGKAVATSLGVVATAWTGGLLTSAPALACGYSISCRPRPIAVNPCCRPQPIFVRPVVVRPIAVSPCCRPRPVYYQPVSHPSCNVSCYSEDQGYDEGNYNDYHEIAFSPYVDANNLSLGDAGQTVALLQQALSDLGYSVSVDGLFGLQTEAAVLAYQRDQGLLVDGVAGGQTLDSLGLAGAGA
jgi:hypothetical protein